MHVGACLGGLGRSSRVHTNQPSRPRRANHRRYLASLNCIEGIPINKRAMTCSGLAHGTVGWQPNSTRDLGERRKMIRHIILHVLRNRPKTRVQGSCNDAVSISDLAHMAKKIELSLYRSAVNMEAYRNASTLSKRISSLIRASEIANRRKSMPN